MLNIISKSKGNLELTMEFTIRLVLTNISISRVDFGFNMVEKLDIKQLVTCCHIDFSFGAITATK
jgi:hypothetical protein